MTQYILSLAAWCPTGFAHMPGVLDAETKEEAEAWALATAINHAFPATDGWYNHTVTVGEFDLMKRQEVST